MLKQKVEQDFTKTNIVKQNSEKGICIEEAEEVYEKMKIIKQET
jgi:hypothetical protein